jgi:hypothetical protein
MGFYLRKSINVGPLRFNLSQNGIGVSAGIPGLRVGTGPRGNYVHMGRGGLYYRATIPTDRAPTSPAAPRRVEPPAADPLAGSPTHGPLAEIDSADVTQIVDSSSRELLDEINTKQRKVRLWPLALTASLLVAGVALYQSWPSWAFGVTVVLGSLVTCAARMRDSLAKTVVLFYELDKEMEGAYGELHARAEQIARAAAAWHVAARGDVHDRKYHAGASQVVNRKNTTIARTAPPYLKTNIETVSIGVGRQTLHFFPDRVLIYAANGVGAVRYSDLRLDIKASRFIEDGSPPHDAQVVDHTWRYVNKSGGPDRRFNNNAQLPICLYDEMTISSASGLNEVIQISKAGTAAPFANAIHQLARVMPVENRSTSKT